MDSTRYYAKMANTPEIQDRIYHYRRFSMDGSGRKIAYQTGDVIYEKATNLVYVLYFHKDDETGDVSTNAKQNWEAQHIVWLPRRADLQQIYHEAQKKGTSHYEVLKNLAAWTRDYAEEITTRVQKGFSMEKIWLMFVMDKIYNRSWNVKSEKWEINKGGGE
jgi:hypothetical protein